MIYFKDDSILLVRTQYHPVQSQVQSGGGGLHSRGIAVPVALTLHG
jgi:hypothetical protein